MNKNHSLNYINKLWLQNWLLILCSLLFVLHQVFEKAISSQLINGYLDDVLCMPIVFGLMLPLFKWIKTDAYHFPLAYVFIGTLYIGFLAEWVFPAYSDAFTRDPYDFIAYFLGAGLFYIIANK